MSFMAGQAIAYLKIMAFGLVIMALIWGAVKIWLAIYNRLQAPTDNGAPD